MTEKNWILTREVAEKKMQRMALEIAEQLSEDAVPILLIGIKDNGMVIAGKIEKLLKPLLTTDIRMIGCSINKKMPADVAFTGQVDFNDINIIIVDDVTNSGRVLLYALKPLLAFHPKKIQILCLVERMHKLFPIKSDYVGISVASTLQDHIQVEVVDGEILGAYLE